MLTFVSCSEKSTSQYEKGDSIVGQAIIGDGDERIQVTKKTVFNDIGKWSGSLQITFIDSNSKEQHFECTGTVLGNGFILTAGHCVFDEENNRVAQKVTFIPQVTLDNVNSSQVFHVEKIWLSKEHQAYPGTENDFALLKILDKEVIRLNSYGRPGIYVLPERDVQLKAKVAGYPSDKKRWDLNLSACEIYTESSTPLIFHDCDTTTGMSGSAIYVYLEKYNKYYLAGIHSRSGTVDSYNVAYKLKREILTDINEIIKGNITDSNYFNLINIESLKSNILQFNNNCGKRIVFAIKYGSNNSFYPNKTTELQVLEKGDVRVFNNTSLDYYFFAADDRKTLTKAEVEIKIPDGKILDFEHERISFPELTLIYSKNICN